MQEIGDMIGDFLLRLMPVADELRLEWATHLLQEAQARAGAPDNGAIRSHQADAGTLIPRVGSAGHRNQ
jgi:hypothetical protein